MKSYPYLAFMATPHVSSNTSANRKISDNIVRTESLDQLKISDKLKVIIAQGFDPEKPDRWSSRSDVVFFVCCELVREGMSDEVILGIITDSRYMISASVLDKGSGVSRYSKRQVSRARDECDKDDGHPMLRAMNESFAIILSYGGKVAVMIEDGQINPDTGKSEPLIQTMKDFRERIKNYPKIPITMPDGKVKTVSAYDWWTGHRRRRQYLGYAFEPGVEITDHVNSWSGFSVAAIPGDRHQRFLDHMFENICDGNQAIFDYLIRWMARCVQFPRTPSMVAPVLLGTRGTGKSVFCDFFGQIFDPHRHIVSDVNALTGKFNAHLARCILVIAEEAFDLRDKRHESVLKEFITGKKISIEPKGFDRIQMRNYAHLIMTSNNERVVPAGDHERRFLVIRVSDKRRQNSAYFKEILKDQKEGGVANLLHYLMSIDLTEYDVTAVPQTAALREQQEHNLSLELEWLLHKLESGMWFDDKPGHGWTKVLKRDLYADYVRYMEAAKARHVRGTRAFHHFVSREIPEAEDKQVYARAGTTDRLMAFVFPPLERCRELYAASRGWSDYKWPQLGEQNADVIEFQQPKRPFE